MSEGIFFKQRPADGSEAIIGEGWTNALNLSDNTGTKHVREILCPQGHEYELDSDSEDEDEASFPPRGDPTTLEGRSSILILSARAYFGIPGRPAIRMQNRKVPG